MNKATIIEEITRKTGQPRSVVENIVNETFDLVSESLAQGNERVLISGFGSFRAVIVPPKKMVSHLNGGQTINVSKTSKVMFDPSDKLKNRITRANKAKVRKKKKS